MTIRPATAADARGIAETHLVESAKGRGLGRGLPGGVAVAAEGKSGTGIL